MSTDTPQNQPATPAPTGYVWGKSGGLEKHSVTAPLPQRTPRAVIRASRSRYVPHAGAKEIAKNENPKPTRHDVTGGRGWFNQTKQQNQ